MTFAELKTRTFKGLNQPADGTGFYSIASVEDALNDALSLVSFLTLAVEESRSLELPPHMRFFHLLDIWPDFLRPLRVKLEVIPGSTDALLDANLADRFMPNEGDLDATLVPVIPHIRPARVQDFAANNPAWLSLEDVPTHYALLGFDLLAINRAVPVAGLKLRVTMARAAADLILPGAVPEIPAAHHTALIDVALFLLRSAEGGFEFLETLFGLKRGMDEVKKLADFMRARSLAQRYDAQPPEMKYIDLSRLLRIRKDLDPKEGGAPSPATPQE